jgi:prophage regulatory protein
MVQKILRLPHVKEVTGLSRSSIYLMMSKGAFPKPILLNSRAVGWIETELTEWINQKTDLRGVTK